MSNTTKVAEQVPAIMQAAGQHLKKLAHDNVALLKRAESVEHENRVMKLARRMELRGINPELDFDAKVAELSGLTGEKLAHMEVAVEIAAGGARLGKIAEAADKDESPRGEGAWRELEDFINGNSQQ